MTTAEQSFTVGVRHTQTSLRAGSPEGKFSEIATVSVISADLDASRRFYGEALGMVAVNDAETKDENRELVCTLVDALGSVAEKTFLTGGRILTPPISVERADEWPRTALIEKPNDELFEIVGSKNVSVIGPGEAR